MKKLFVLVFAIALCLGALCVGASASGAEPPPQVDGVYQLDSDDDLYWFAEQVNGGEYGANAVLTADITINTGVLDENGNLITGKTFTQWTPIGEYREKAYTGTFDGRGYTISGLYYYGSGDYVGLFGYIGSSGRVQNVNIADSYISNNEGVSDTGGVPAPSASMIDSSLTASSAASSLTVGSRPSRLLSCSRWRATFIESSFRLRLTLTVPPSRNSRRISPRITGTA